ncbi:MAG: hypothetical protein COV57_00650 [Candidatus Liptonbacteria bacterium CG11_big_fil_rev_8_21_14_0_20_35_14]|uniref:Thioredoxin domain-containing protein n=1 Tax=Candidatus Liptonbacteria bacterium CG11_big_fil_rev_8_21_14_0_20_35_14 TaxID=1974634 RepID=A0A2H0N8B6_9BACT|nr:MAG: hypothetical protein COV57_00650 [Candidatus Liptonbacteria bacterium CG11_big_fil_rev_8_21_14_0_20_35_14]
MNQTNNYTITISIIIASLIIAVAIIFSGGGGNDGVASSISNNFKDNQPTRNNEAGSSSTIRPVSSDDHILGDLGAPITIVEYSDFECPFCQRVHPTLSRVVEDYQGEVKWVYRHFPLTNIHSNAQSAAVASECVAKLGGGDSFWEFANQVFENQRSLDNDLYKSIAQNLNIDAEEFNSCLSDKSIIDEVNTDRAEATKAGGRGTPFSIIIDKEGNTTPVSGALPYESWQQIIDELI